MSISFMVLFINRVTLKLFHATDNFKDYNQGGLSVCVFVRRISPPVVGD